MRASKERLRPARKHLLSCLEIAECWVPVALSPLWGRTAEFQSASLLARCRAGTAPESKGPLVTWNPTGSGTRSSGRGQALTLCTRELARSGGSGHVQPRCQEQGTTRDSPGIRKDGYRQLEKQTPYYLLLRLSLRVFVLG